MFHLLILIPFLGSWSVLSFLSVVCVFLDFFKGFIHFFSEDTYCLHVGSSEEFFLCIFQLYWSSKQPELVWQDYLKVLSGVNGTHWMLTDSTHYFLSVILIIECPVLLRQGKPFTQSYIRSPTDYYLKESFTFSSLY